MPECRHVWVSNAGQGGKPVFVLRPEKKVPTMHVQCMACRARTQLTQSEWNSLGRVGDSAQVRRARFKKSGETVRRTNEFATE